MNKNTVIFSLVCLLIGFVSAYVFLAQKKVTSYDKAEVDSFADVSPADDRMSVANPFASKDSDRLDMIEDELELVKQQMHELEYAIQNMSVAVDSESKLSPRASLNSNLLSPVFNRRLYNIENLIKGGIDTGIAEDIVRRKNSIELKRLELLDRAKRDNYLGTQRYIDELESINQQDVDLREELGDERYDAYLFNSKQNNRIKVASVMLGSTAEQAGIQKNDVVLSYDNNRMFNWQELKDATAGGQLGEYVSIDIYRDGQIYSFSVPRGPLGIQLGATRLEP